MQLPCYLCKHLQHTTLHWENSVVSRAVYLIFNLSFLVIIFFTIYLLTWSPTIQYLDAVHTFPSEFVLDKGNQCPKEPAMKEEAGEEQKMHSPCPVDKHPYVDNQQKAAHTRKEPENNLLHAKQKK